MSVVATALDASYVQHPAEDILAAGFAVAQYYTGNARPTAEYLASLYNAGLFILLIQESTPERALSGYAAGVVDGQYAARRVEEAGLPEWVVIALCVSDNTANTPSGEAARIAIHAYVQGFSDACGNHTIALYGNRFAVDAGRDVAKVIWTWVPSTWYCNETDGMWQMANIASPLEGTDLNWILIPLEQLGAAGSSQPPTPTPAPLTEVDDDMIIIQGFRFSTQSTETWLTLGDVPIHQFTGTPSGPYLVPQDAIDYNTANPAVRITGVDSGVIDTLSTIAHKGQVDPEVDVDALVAAVRLAIENSHRGTEAVKQNHENVAEAAIRATL